MSNNNIFLYNLIFQINSLKHPQKSFTGRDPIHKNNHVKDIDKVKVILIIYNII